MQGNDTIKGKNAKNNDPVIVDNIVKIKIETTPKIPTINGFASNFKYCPQYLRKNLWLNFINVNILFIFLFFLYVFI